MVTIYNREDFELELGFTKVYKANKAEHKAIREARCLEWQIPRILLEIDSDDLVPGGCQYGAVGFSSQIGGFLYYYHEDQILAEMERKKDDPEYVQELEELLEFWRAEDCKTRLRKNYSEQLLLAMPTDNWETEGGVTFPLYRMAGGSPDFIKLLRLGLPGLVDLIDQYLEKAPCNSEAWNLYKGMQISLETLKGVIECYRDQAIYKAKEAKKAGREEEAKGMQAIDSALSSILIERPRHLLEAVELFWMYIVVSEVRDYGRIDNYLSDFYVADIDSGYLTEEQADGIILKLWERMGKRLTSSDGRIFVGGRGRRNEKNADRLAISCIQATRVLKNPDPQLSLRFYEGMNQEVINLTYEAIGEGCTYPILYNDDVIIRDVERAFNLTYEEAQNYVPFGCGEYVIDHKSIGTPSGVLNLLKGLEIFIHYGKAQDAKYLEDNMGMEVLGAIKEIAGVLKPFEEYQTFDEFYENYKKWIAFHIRQAAGQEKAEYDFTGEVCSFLFRSMLFDDCCERGKGMFEGGLRYLGGTLESYGNVNTADSLYAIKKLVFDEKVITKAEILTALDHNFDGYEIQQSRMKKCDKFGNDQEGPDLLLKDLHRFVCLTAKDQAKRNNLHSYLIVVINNSANTTMGFLTRASADGRRAYTPMANANSPQAGGNKKGVTATLNSMLKMDTDIHAGAVQNIKFSTDTFNNDRKVTRGTLEAYFKNGGAQLMVSVMGREDLQNAIKYPEKYANLLVRVGGFTARFVELSKEIQGEILSRTCY